MWGKTDRESGEWLPLVQHLEDTRQVAGHLWDTWLPEIVRHRIADTVGGQPDLARSLVTWLGACHDVGKATPAFASQVYDLGTLDHVLEPAKAAGMEVPRLARSQRKGFHHTVTGQVIVETWLSEVYGMSPRRSAVQVAGVVGGHHGTPLSAGVRTAGGIEFRNPRSAPFGDSQWRDVQLEILDEMARRTDVGPALATIRERGLPLTVQMDLTAIVIVADWLASDPARFPYDLTMGDQERWVVGRATLDLAPPWEPLVGVDDPQELLQARFPHLQGRTANPVQRAAVRIADEAAEAPLMIVEAPMGQGKTEAALLAAERLASRFGSGGVFVGLPTMATSDGMFSRVLGWLEHGSPGARPSVHLAHSKAGLNQQYRGLVSQSLRARGVYDDDQSDDGASPVVNQWTRGRKKGVLASVVVGTIDQALFVGLQTKHLALRHLALSGKVVIIDEVHAADDYMRTYLCRVLEWLGRYGTPVILMSATLPSAQRHQLVDAYRTGRSGSASPVEYMAGGYPRITSVTQAVETETVPAGQAGHRVAVEFVDADVSTIARRLTDEVVDGGCVAAVVNTVGRAQELYEQVVQVLPASEVVLVHSQFIGPDRMTKEQMLRDRLGPPSPERDRPGRLVVIGTQVLEQSLDIDVDLMLTDVAPMDLVLQRAGRLHRHDRPPSSRPERLRRPGLLVAGAGTSPSLAATPEIASSAAAVYGRHRLLRATEMLIDSVHQGIHIPQDIPRLVESAYDEDRPSPTAWESEWHQTARDDVRRRAAAVAAANTFRLPPVDHQRSMVDLLPRLLDAESDDLERTGRAQVRDTDDSLEVLLAVRGDDGLLRLPLGVWGGGEVIPSVLGDRDRKVAMALATCSVRLPRTLTHPGVIERIIAELESEPAVAGWQGDPFLAGQLLVILSPDGEGKLLGHKIVYDSVIGLKVESVGEGSAP